MINQEFYAIEKKTVNKAQAVLHNSGMDLFQAIQLMIEKIAKDENLDFLMPERDRKEMQYLDIDTNLKHTAHEDVLKYYNQNLRFKMTKQKAISLLKREGIELTGNISFASKNKTNNHYWSSPEVSYLKEEWNIILNDNVNSRLYLFIVPANTYGGSDFIIRNDQPEKLDLQITYDDITFTDKRSKKSFEKHLKKIVGY